MNTAEKLKFIRREERLSQSEFADMVGISRRSLISWENEGRIMGIDKLEQITSNERFRKYAILLATSDDHNDGCTGLETPTKQEIIQMVGDMDEERAGKILEYIKFFNAQNPRDNQGL